VYSGYGVMPAVVSDALDPVCPADGVVIAVGATGVCRSDWHAWRGHDPVALPHIGGHEYAGVVAAVGPEVTRWRAGAVIGLEEVGRALAAMDELSATGGITVAKLPGH
jgi:D-arabinose 1-dehydrogenase-like Zn-dependent alcohol dehydrogenase